MLAVTSPCFAEVQLANIFADHMVLQHGRVECTPATEPGFSGVGYFFGRELMQTLDTPIDAWSSWEKLTQTPEARVYVERIAHIEANDDKFMAEHEEKVKPYQAEEARAKAAGDKPKMRRARPPMTRAHPKAPVALYNLMNHFVIAGEDQQFVWADNPQVNLYNKAELPALPFRTNGRPPLAVNNQ